MDSTSSSVPVACNVLRQQSCPPPPDGESISLFSEVSFALTGPAGAWSRRTPHKPQPEGDSTSNSEAGGGPPSKSVKVRQIPVKFRQIPVKFPSNSGPRSGPSVKFRRPAVMIAFPCSTFSVTRFFDASTADGGDKGPPVIRTAAHLSEIESRDTADPTRFRTSR